MLPCPKDSVCKPSPCRPLQEFSWNSLCFPKKSIYRRLGNTWEQFYIDFIGNKRVSLRAKLRDHWLNILQAAVKIPGKRNFRAHCPEKSCTSEFHFQNLHFRIYISKFLSRNLQFRFCYFRICISEFLFKNSLFQNLQFWVFISEFVSQNLYFIFYIRNCILEFFFQNFYFRISISKFSLSEFSISKASYKFCLKIQIKNQESFLQDQEGRGKDWMLYQNFCKTTQIVLKNQKN